MQGTGVFKGWIGVDFDGTLAKYEGWKGADVLGSPIQPVVDAVKRKAREGTEIRIVTARVSHDGTTARVREAIAAREAIQGWCQRYLGFVPQITNEKDWIMIELWDDRAVQVETNTGRRIDGREWE